MEYSKNEIIALFNESKSGKSMILVSEGKMHIMSKALFERVKAGKVKKVIFADEGTLDLNGTEVITTKVKSFVDSEKEELTEQFEITDLKLKLQEVMAKLKK